MLRRVTLGLLAALALLTGVACGAVAVWTALVLGPSDGVLRYPIGTISPGPDARALLLDVERFDADVPYIGSWGSSTFAVQADPVTDLFLGAAATPDADAYLAGVAYSVGVRVGGQWQVRDVPGEASPPPTAQGTWLASGQGDRPALGLPTSRPLTVVILRPDGGLLGPVALGVDFTVPEVSRYVLWLSVASVVLVLVGLLLTFLAIQRLRPGRHAAPRPVRGRHAAGRVPVGEEGVVRDEHPVG